jgi:hypothetical protein
MARCSMRPRSLADQISGDASFFSMPQRNTVTQYCDAPLSCRATCESGDHVLLLTGVHRLSRSGPPPRVVQQESDSMWPKRDVNLDQQQLHALMAKASGWDPGIVRVRALQQAYGSLQC